MMNRHAHLSFFDELICAADKHDALMAAGFEYTALAVKLEMMERVGAWISDQAARISAEVAQQEQVAAARESAGMTALQRDEGVPF